MRWMTGRGWLVIMPGLAGWAVLIQAFAWTVFLVDIWTGHMPRAGQIGLWAIGLVYMAAWAWKRVQLHRLVRRLAEIEKALADEAGRAARMQEFIEEIMRARW